MAKQKMVTLITTEEEPTLKKLELVHTNVYGFTSITSVRGLHYYVTSINDSMQKVWVYFLKHKSKVFATFKT